MVQPGNPEAYCSLGLLAQKAGDMAEATQDYERSAAVEPTPVAYLLLAQAFEIQGQAEAARAAQSQAARMTRNLAADLAAVKQLLAR
jgi:uncharacterized protein HemY